VAKFGWQRWANVGWVGIKASWQNRRCMSPLLKAEALVGRAVAPAWPSCALIPTWDTNMARGLDVVM
jgi:hypothetical protein